MSPGEASATDSASPEGDEWVVVPTDPAAIDSPSPASQSASLAETQERRRDEAVAAAGAETETRTGSPRPTGNGNALQPGTRIGRYRVGRELGRGGVGVVVEAFDDVLDRAVALKLLIAGRDASDAQLRRFLREARAASSLRHPHIVSVHDIGEVDGRVYFAMDRIEGRTLGALVDADGPLPPRRAAEIARDVARALEHAHAHGIVHRDVKPDNIIMDASGKAWLTDFGLARDLEEEARLTATGQVVGTPAYASPEQLCGRAVDERSDVYSLGATLFEAIAKRPPFQAATFPLLSWKVVNEPAPPLRSLAPQVARDLESVALICLEKDPARRYASAALLAEDLERFLRGESVRARPTGAWVRALQRSKRHWPIVAGVALATVGLSFAFVYTGALRQDLAKAGELERFLERERRRLLDAQERSNQKVRVEEGRRRILTELVGTDDPARRLEVLARALEVDPGYWEGRCERAHLLRLLSQERRRSGDPKGAREAAALAREEIALALSQAPAVPPATLLLLDAEVARRELHDVATAGSVYAELARGPDEDGTTLYARGRLGLLRGDVAAATSATELAVAKAPDLLPLRLLEAELALEQRDGARALAVLDRAVALTGGASDAEVFLLRALAFDDLGDAERARADLDRALELDPEDAVARRLRGRLRLVQGAVALAWADLDRAVQLDPHQIHARLLRARARALLLDPAGAAADLEEAERLGFKASPEVRAFLLAPPPNAPEAVRRNP